MSFFNKSVVAERRLDMIGKSLAHVYIFYSLFIQQLAQCSQLLTLPLSCCISFEGVVRLPLLAINVVKWIQLSLRPDTRRIPCTSRHGMS
jgi:hypothetical protein